MVLPGSIYDNELDERFWYKTSSFGIREEAGNVVYGNFMVYGEGKTNIRNVRNVIVTLYHEKDGYGPFVLDENSLKDFASLEKALGHKLSTVFLECQSEEAGELLCESVRRGCQRKLFSVTTHYGTFGSYFCINNKLQVHRATGERLTWRQTGVVMNLGEDSRAGSNRFYPHRRPIAADAPVGCRQLGKS